MAAQKAGDRKFRSYDRSCQNCEISGAINLIRCSKTYGSVRDGQAGNTSQRRLNAFLES